METALTLTIMLQKSLLLSSLIFLGFNNLFGQSKELDRSKIFHFGLGIRSLVATDMLTTGEVNEMKEGVRFASAPQVSFGLDARIRMKLKGRFSLQSGISSLRRNYNFETGTDSLSYSGQLRLSSFSIPISGLLKVPISKRAKVGVEFGLAGELMPSEVGAGEPEGYYSHIYVHRRFRTTLSMGTQFTQEFYNGWSAEIGVHYTRMLGRLGSYYSDYDPENVTKVVSHRNDLLGHYFSIQLLVFFP